MKKILLARAILPLLAVFLSANVALAATCTVTKTADTNDGVCDGADCSLREAVADASCSLINFSISLVEQPVLITLGDIGISRAVTIKGFGADATTIQSNNVFRIFYVQAGANAVITGMKLTGGGGNGTGTGGGGAIKVVGGQLTLDRVYLTGNSSQLGAAFSGNAIIRNSTISGNVSGSTWNEGAVIAGTSFKLYNSTITGNTGTGIFTMGFPELYNSTVTNNGGPGVYMDFAAILEVTNSIVLDIYQFDQWSGIFSFGSNILSNAPGTSRPLNAGSGDLVGVDPMLGPLANYGGRVPVKPLLAGSPGIDTGDNQRAINAGLTTDQRGHLRIFDGDGNGSAIVDRGAVEFGAPVAATFTVSGRVLGAVSGNPLRSQVVTLVDLQGNARTALSSSFGWFIFDNVPADAIYKVRVNARRGVVEKVVFADQNLSDADILIPGL